MPLTQQTVERIRAVILARAAGSPALLRFDTASGSPLWLIANAIAHEARKIVTDTIRESLNCIPSTATGAALLEWVRTFLPDGVYAATAWVGTIQLQAEAGATPAVPIFSEIVHADGTRYQTTAAVAAGDWSGPGGTVVVAAQALTLGAGANKAPGTLLSLASPPVGCRASCALVATVTEGLDAESEADLQARLRVETRGRPGSGKPADVVAWGLRHGRQFDVGSVYVYPRYETPLDGVLVPLVHDAVRLLDGADSNALQALAQAEAAYALDLRVARVAGVAPDLAIVTSAILPEFEVVARPGWGPDWTYPAFAATVAIGSAEPRVQLSADPTGAIEAGQHVVVRMTDGVSCFRVQLEVVAVGANYVDTEGWPAGYTPVVGDDLVAGGPLWQPIQDAIRAHFLTLGPWAIDPALVGAAPVLHRQRYPDPDSEGPPGVYVSDLLAAIDNLPGTSHVEWTQYWRDGGAATPAADIAEVLDPTVPDPIGLFVLSSEGASVVWV